MPRRKQPQDEQPNPATVAEGEDGEAQSDGSGEPEDMDVDLELDEDIELDGELDVDEDGEDEDEDEDDEEEIAPVPVAPPPARGKAGPRAPVTAGKRSATGSAPDEQPEPRRALGRSLTITLDPEKFDALAKEARELGLDTGSLARVFILNGLRSQQGLGRDAAPIRPEARPAPSAGFGDRGPRQDRERDGGRSAGGRGQEGFFPRAGGGGGRDRDVGDRPARDRGPGGWNRGPGGGERGGGSPGGWNRGPGGGERGGGGGWRGGEQGGGPGPRGSYGSRDSGPRRPPRGEWEDRGPYRRGRDER